MFKRGLGLAISGFLVLSITGCIQHHTERVVTEQLPPTQIEKSFQTNQKSFLRLQKSSLGKIFLLRASIKYLKNAPSWEDMKPMIVTFQKSDDQIGMFEMDTYSAYSVIETKRLVSQFKVASETENEIEFEWGKGLKIILRPFYDDVTNPDLNDTAKLESEEGLSPGVETVASFVRSSEIKGNQLHIRQSVRVRMPTLRMKAVDPMKPDEKAPLLEVKEAAGEVDYVIKPYAVNPNFKLKEIDPLRRVGFFKTTVGQDETSDSKIAYATHWDMSPEAGPITFALSKNFPREVLPAVKEGILYWNIVLGADKIQVIEDFDPESDFPDRTVVVHWLPWIDAGSAWANFQTDPLTGEILRGQIYITSVFLDVSKVYPTSDPEAPLALAGMSSSQVCQYPLPQAVTTTGMKPDGQKQYRADQLRHVVAHEVGHTLGMRHNFAGSMDSTLKANEINIEKKKYETDPHYAGAPLSSTIMDYIRGLEEGMIGRWLKTQSLGYDVDALKWVNSDQIPVETKYSFCTDDDIYKATIAKEKLFGCERFDAPANPFNIRPEETQRVISQLVQHRFDGLIEAMYPAKSNQVRELEAVLTEDYNKTYASLTGASSNLSSLIYTPLSYLYMSSGSKYSQTVVYFKNRTEKRWDSQETSLSEVLKNHLQEAGGLAAMMKAIVPLDANGNYDPHAMKIQLMALQASPKFSKGVTAGGRAYELDEKQQARLAKYIESGITSFDATVQYSIASMKPTQEQEQIEDGKTVKVSKTFQYSIGQDQWFPETAKFLKMMILSQKDLTIVELNGRDISYKSNSVPSYYRKTLVEMLSPQLWSSYLVQKPEVAAVKSELIARFNTLYQQLPLSSEMTPPTSDKTADHEAFLNKLDGQTLPSAIKSILLEDLEILKELEKIM